MDSVRPTDVDDNTEDQAVIDMDDALAATSITPARQVVSVERLGQAIVVRPACAEVFAVLQTTKHVYASRHDLGGRTVQVAENLFKVEDDFGGPQTVLPAGLESVALHMLERAGFGVNYSNETLLPPRAIPVPDVTAALRLGPVDRAMLELVHDHDRGLVRFKAGAVKPARLIARIRGWPSPAMTLAAVARRQRLRRTQARPTPPEAFAGPGRRRRRPLPGALEARSRGDLPGARRARHRDRKEGLLDLSGRRRGGSEANARLAIPHAEASGGSHGFLEIGRHLAPYDADWMAALFGVEEVVIPRHGHVGRPVEVVAVTSVGGRGRAADPGTVAIKRQALWRHGLRNRRLATLARALAGGDQQRLVAEYPAVAAPHAGRSAPLRVAVLVENVEHALGIAERLPGWPIVAGSHVATVGLPGRPAALWTQRRREGAGTPARAIVTMAGLEGPGLEKLDVLIRGDGGPHVPPALDGIVIRASVNIRRPLLVVDLDDRHHPRLRAWARRRRAAYRERGWVVGRYPVRHDTRIERFLGRPAGGAR